MTDTENTEAVGEVFDQFNAPTPTKTVVLSRKYVDADDTEHKADTKIELDRDEADRLLHAGLARTVELDEQLKAEVAAVKAPPLTSIEAILATVGDSPEKAKLALKAEKAGKNRTTLVSKLEAIANIEKKEA